MKRAVLRSNSAVPVNTPQHHRSRKMKSEGDWRLDEGVRHPLTAHAQESVRRRCEGGADSAAGDS